MQSFYTIVIIVHTPNQFEVIARQKETFTSAFIKAYMQPR